MILSLGTALLAVSSSSSFWVLLFTGDCIFKLTVDESSVDGNFLGVLLVGTLSSSCWLRFVFLQVLVLNRLRLQPLQSSVSLVNGGAWWRLCSRVSSPAEGLAGLSAIGFPFRSSEVDDCPAEIFSSGQTGFLPADGILDYFPLLKTS